MDALDLDLESVDPDNGVLAPIHSKEQTADSLQRPWNLAQGISCAPHAIAVPYAWARTIVEEFELVAVPKAPAWLAGLANVMGVVLPVIDLGAYLSPQSQPGLIQRRHRLLVGGDYTESAERAYALLFSDLPVQLRYQRELVDSNDPAPPALQPVLLGRAHDAHGKQYWEIDPVGLAQELFNAL